MVGYDNDDYELLPHQEIERLREENAHLRQNPFKDRAEPKDLQGSIDRLNENMEKLIKLLSDTNHEMVKEFKTSSLQENFKTISSQNEKIAEGILTVAQLIQAPAQTSQATGSAQSSQTATNSLDQVSSEQVSDSSLSSNTATPQQVPMQADQSAPQKSMQAPPPSPNTAVPNQQASSPQNNMPAQAPASSQGNNSENMNAQSAQQQKAMSPPPPPTNNPAPPAAPKQDMNLPPPPSPKKKGFGLFKK